MDLTTCSQFTRQGHLCGKPAAYLFTWPGNDEKAICEECSRTLRNVATAMGLHVQLKPATPAEGG